MADLECIAKSTGVIDGARIREGEKFTLSDESQFTEAWMVRAGDYSKKVAKVKEILPGEAIPNDYVEKNFPKKEKPKKQNPKNSAKKNVDPVKEEVIPETESAPKLVD